MVTKETFFKVSVYHSKSSLVGSINQKLNHPNHVTWILSDKNTMLISKTFTREHMTSITSERGGGINIIKISKECKQAINCNVVAL